MNENEKNRHIMRQSQNIRIMHLWTKKRVLYEKDIDEYLYNLGYKNVGVYGMGDIGECIAITLMKSNYIVLKCGIDKNPCDCYVEGLDIVRIDCIPNDIDVVIVSLSDIYDDVKRILEKNCSADIISIEEIVYKMSGDEKNGQF